MKFIWKALHFSLSPVAEMAPDDSLTSTVSFAYYFCTENLLSNILYYPFYQKKLFLSLKKRKTDFDLIWSKLLDYGHFGIMIHFWILVRKEKKKRKKTLQSPVFGFKTPFLDFSQKNPALVYELYFGKHIVFNRWKKWSTTFKSNVSRYSILANDINFNNNNNYYYWRWGNKSDLFVRYYRVT